MKDYPILKTSLNWLQVMNQNDFFEVLITLQNEEEENQIFLEGIL